MESLSLCRIEPWRTSAPWETYDDPVTVRARSKQIRDNLVCKLRAGAPLFPGIIGYDETVIPQLVNAILSRHNFILLGLRGQAKSRILRALADLLDEQIPVVPGCEIHDDPLAPIVRARAVRAVSRRRRRPADRRGCRATIAYVEKLATPDVTIADMVGDIDPIKAAQARPEPGRRADDALRPAAAGATAASSRSTSCPTSPAKIQVGLFNILQEGDVQIKGYPIRLQLDLMLVFTANPEDYTARGKIITPLQRPHRLRNSHALSRDRPNAVAITAQEAWTDRTGAGRRSRSRDYVREVVEEVAFQARADRKIDKRSGVEPATADHDARNS